MMHVRESGGRGEYPDEVFEALLGEWWEPIIDELCDAGGGQPPWDSLAFREKQREAWRQRWREAAARQRLHRAQNAKVFGDV